MSAETTREVTVEQWTKAIEDSRLILDDGLTPADIAAEFDDVARETMADLCREAVLQVERDRSAVILDDFRAARGALDADDQDGEEDTLSAADSLEVMLDDVDGLADNADSHRDERDGEPDASPPADRQSSLSSSDTDSPVEPIPSAMDRDALEGEVSDNRERIATLEAQVETLQEVANRDVAIMRGALQELLGGDVVDDVSDLPEAAQQFRAEHDRADRVVREGAVPDGGEGSRTKVELATDLAKAEAVRVSTKGLQGGAIDYPDVRDIADRQHDTDLHSGTVYDAFDRLKDRWDCFEVKTGGDGPNTQNKQLRCLRDEIPQSLLNQLHTEGN
ncbi:hypothetical protein [Saliphagus sp. LR7]|uniref:hypothetical protein n=1 Tax=Saliphagus sp. LR7 TaxID=2282654 RepID=UPI000DF7235A|nr:hypothetical protein [Saliphagus sp. LR7]